MSEKHTQEFQLRTMSTLILSTCLLLAGCGAGDQDAPQEAASARTVPAALPGTSTSTLPGTSTSTLNTTESPEQTEVEAEAFLEDDETNIIMDVEPETTDVSSSDGLPGHESESAGANDAPTEETPTSAPIIVATPPPPVVANTIAVATIQWQAPDQRENGDNLFLYEIAGYEVQYRAPDTTAYTVLRVPEDDGAIDQQIEIELDRTVGLEILVASYDNNGLYSDYQSVSINAQAPAEETKPPVETF